MKEHVWVDTGYRLDAWPPIMIFECSVCAATGKLFGYLDGPDQLPSYDDTSEMKCKTVECVQKLDKENNP